MCSKNLPYMRPANQLKRECNKLLRHAKSRVEDEVVVEEVLAAPTNIPADQEDLHLALIQLSTLQLCSRECATHEVESNIKGRLPENQPRL